MIEKELLRFSAVGVLSTAFNYLSFLFLYSLLNVNYLVSSGTGYVIGVSIGYYLNRTWTFNFSEDSLKLKGKYFIIYSISLFLGLVFLHFLVEKLKLMTEIANIVVIMFTMLCNFVGTKYWVFHK